MAILPLCASRSSASAAGGQAATLRRSPGRALERSGLCLGKRYVPGEGARGQSRMDNQRIGLAAG
jgi:hypothetical protein